jgi:hypothetical protein
VPRFFVSAFIISGLLLSACSNNSESLSIDPGEWEITTSSAISILPHAVSDTITKCLASNELKPDLLIEESMGCSYTQLQTKGSELSWELSCTKSSGTLAGTGSLKTSGKKAFSGGIQLTAPSEINTLTIGKNWDAKYIGPCK